MNVTVLSFYGGVCLQVPDLLSTFRIQQYPTHHEIRNRIGNYFDLLVFVQAGLCRICGCYHLSIL